MTHLFEVHAYGVVEDIGLGGFELGFFGLLEALFIVFDFLGIEDIDFEVFEDGDDVFDFFGVIDAIGEGGVDILDG